MLGAGRSSQASQAFFLEQWVPGIERSTVRQFRSGLVVVCALHACINAGVASKPFPAPASWPIPSLLVEAALTRGSPCPGVHQSELLVQLCWPGLSEAPPPPALPPPPRLKLRGSSEGTTVRQTQGTLESKYHRYLARMSLERVVLRHDLLRPLSTEASLQRQRCEDDRNLAPPHRWSESDEGWMLLFD